MPIPLQGTPGFLDTRNPTLLPNFYKPVVIGNTTGLRSPRGYVQSNPRVSATASATVGGTVTAGDVITLTFSVGTLPGGSLAVKYTVVSTDTTETIAESLATAVNVNPTAQNYGLTAGITGAANPEELNFLWTGPIGNFVTISASVSGSATETITLSPSNGLMSGGSGPIIASNNFSYQAGNSTHAYFFGNPYNPPYTVLADMVRQGMPIV